MELTQWATAWILVLFVVGLILLFAGGHALVRGSSRLARNLGVHPIVVGLTVVALGTSMPEFVVSLVAAVQNKADVALGNVVGSNISNMALILGLASLLRPISINLRILKFEMPLVLGITVLFWWLCGNKLLSRIEGLALFMGFVVYIALVIKYATKEPDSVDEVYRRKLTEEKGLGINLLFILVGIVGLAVGANWIVNSASEISRRAGVPELILGLTIVAIGTSLPELATSVVAAIKNEGDISIGNILGSNMFNMMAIAGPTALVHPLAVSYDVVRYHLPLMTGLTLILFPILRTGHKLSRSEGGFLFLFYVGIFTWWAII
ncbi:calcium/sodium antiporter [candidate division KSB1 bacterium]|nr:calcium/sodium antiporter [candidate division KSB1 bacterium]NIR68415.1 calcium/sodium antiporter [candidate division KSB1 bacterium]NIS27092.1 calcium/sodium antiporter [candidate division KSB1 bacterium]NIT73946.1 calcium/sodium antiporter [candidate division KSB1 bacterium]NIU27836.1 calcium/sodium antiporter [candidate division KSB1 bacterium]